MLFPMLPLKSLVAQVVPDGFGVAYMTGFDGEFYEILHLHVNSSLLLETDRLQYTVTSRKEMPNTRFCAEIARAAKDLYDLHAEDKARL